MYVRSKISPEIQQEVFHILVGMTLGFSAHKIGKYWLHLKGGRQLDPIEPVIEPPVEPTGRFGRWRRFRRLRRFLKLQKLLDGVVWVRGGDLVTANVALQLLLRILESAGSDVAGSLISGSLLGILTYLGKNSHLVQDATVGGVYSRALTQVHQGIPILTSIRQAICHRNDTYFAQSILSDSDNKDKRKALKRFIRRVFKRTGTPEQKLWFVMCLASLLLFLWATHRYGTAITLLEALHDAFLSGEITETAYRGILRKLDAEDVPLDPGFWPEITTFKVKDALEGNLINIGI